jgi:hypothetical protein
MLAGKSEKPKEGIDHEGLQTPKHIKSKESYVGYYYAGICPD